jgi:hypothetical protein
MEKDIEEKIVREAERIGEDCLFSAKGHFYAAQFWTDLHLWLGIPMAILAAISGGSALSQFDYHNIVAGALALIVTALAAVSTFLNPNEKSSIHGKAGNGYNILREQLRAFSEIDASLHQDEEALLRRLNEFRGQKKELDQNSPQIPHWAYKRAKRGIEAGEGNYKIDNT